MRQHWSARRFASWPIAAQLILLLVLVTAAAMVLSYHVQSRGLAKYARSQDGVRADTAAHTARVLFEDEIKRLEQIGRILGADADVRRMLAPNQAGAPPTIGNELDRTLGRLGADRVEIYDARGTLLFKTHAVDSADRHAGIDAALGGLGGTYFAPTAAGLAIRVSAPLFGDTGIVGVISVGSLIDEVHAGRLAAQARAGVYFSSSETVWAASDPARRDDVLRTDVIQATLRDRAPQIHPDASNNRTLVYSPILLGDATFVLIVEVDHAEEVLLAARIRANTLGLFGTIVALTILGVVLTTGRFVQPLRELREEALALATRYASDIQPQREANEIVDLQRAFRGLAAALGSHEARLASQGATQALMFFCAQTANADIEPVRTFGQILGRVREYLGWPLAALVLARDALNGDAAGSIVWDPGSASCGEYIEVRSDGVRCLDAAGEGAAAWFNDIELPPGACADLTGVQSAIVLPLGIAGRRVASMLFLHPARLPVDADTLATLGYIIGECEQVVARRIAAEDLMRAKHNAEAATRAKSEFLATMSHEIRTPINGVLGMAELVLETNLDEQQRRYVTMAHRSGEALLGIINDILDFSKIEAGRLELESIDFDLRQVVGDVTVLLAETAREKGLRLSADVDASVPARLRGDPGRLRQVLINLVGNAVKFTETGSVRISIGATPADGGWCVRCMVQDTGIGITAEAQSRLFTAFSQADSSTTRRFGGTGLGLAIVKQLVEAMGGTISVESEPGRGSCFGMNVRLGAASEPAAENAAATPNPSAALPPAGGARIAGRVLLAEDNQVNRVIAVSILKQLGCIVDVVGNGAEAVEAVERARYDLVLMDCQMPLMDGYEATARIRAREAGDDPGEHLRIVAVTANAVSGDRERCLAAGMDDYLCKPYRKEHLQRIVEHHLKDARPVAVADA